VVFSDTRLAARVCDEVKAQPVTVPDLLEKSIDLF
jgi:hypothetical protein